MQPDAILDVLDRAAIAVREALAVSTPRGSSGQRLGQYNLDLVADAAACPVLLGAGFGIFSEESDLTDSDRDVVVVLDPVDGSTNADRGLPWYSISMCALEHGEPLVGLVVNLVLGERYHAIRGQGAFRDETTISPSACTDLSSALISACGYSVLAPGWAQFRTFGGAALEICAVADGRFDGFACVGGATLRPWDYLGAQLVCLEAGGIIGDRFDRPLVITEPGDDREIIAAANPTLYEQLRKATEGQPSSLPLAAK